MQIYLIFERKRFIETGKTIGTGLGTILAGLLGSATVTCASCLTPLFTLLGISLSTIIFVFNYRWYIVIAVILLMLMTIYLTARKINKICDLC